MNTSQTTQNADASAMSRLRKFRPTWPAVLLFTALLAQAPHAGTVFFRIAPDHATQFENWFVFLGAFVYAIALEGATAYFVWHNKMRWAIAFAAFSIAHNVAYYMPNGWTFDIAGERLTLRYMVSGLLISASIPIAIAAFSHVHVEDSAKEHGAAPAPAKAHAKPREHFWQFWRPAATTPTEAPTNATARSNTTVATTAPHSAPPVVTAQPVAPSPAPAAQPPAAPTEPQPTPPAGRRLTDAEKQTIINMSANGMKGAAIAKALDLNENTVRSIIARASKPAVHHNGVAKEPSL